MFEIKRLLKVPKDKELRKVLLSEVGLFVSEHKILPPSDFKTLENCACALLSAPIGLYFASLWYDEKLYPTNFYLEALARMLEIK
jgi:hypothetical protein